MRLLRSAVLGFALISCSDMTEPERRPDPLQPIGTGSGQTGLVSNALADSLQIEVRTSKGAPVGGKIVRWAVRSGGGSIEPSESVTDSAGRARARWVLGGAPGTDTAIAMVDSLETRFIATARDPDLLRLHWTLNLFVGMPGVTTYTSAHGRVETLMLFFDEGDSAATSMTPAAVYQHLVPRTREMFSQLSWGRMSLEVDTVLRWIRLPRARSSYTLTMDWMRDLLLEVDSQVDFTKYEQIFLVAGPQTQQCSSGANAWTDDARFIVLDGANLHSFVFLCRNVLTAANGAEEMVHEAAHGYGLWDLYDVSPNAPSGFPAGLWDPMSIIYPRLRHFTAFSQNWLGWTLPGEIKTFTTGGIEDVVSPMGVPGGVKALALKLDSSNAIVAEVRESVGLDAPLCRPGVLLYRVDASRGSAAGALRPIMAVDSYDNAECGARGTAPFRVGEGYVDPALGYEMKVLEKTAAGYRIRLKRL